jgi:hypothetical protein
MDATRVDVFVRNWQWFGANKRHFPLWTPGVNARSAVMPARPDHSSDTVVGFRRDAAGRALNALLKERRQRERRPRRINTTVGRR